MLQSTSFSRSSSGGTSKDHLRKVVPIALLEVGPIAQRALNGYWSHPSGCPPKTSPTSATGPISDAYQLEYKFDFAEKWVPNGLFTLAEILVEVGLERSSLGSSLV